MVMTTNRGWRSRRIPNRAVPRHVLAREDMAELLGEQFVLAVTCAEEMCEEVRNEFSDEEVGGPFIEGRTP